MSKEQFKLLVDGKEAFTEIFRSIEEAKKSIYVETFIFSDDETGWKMARLLGEKAQAGLDVRVLYDQIGTYYFSIFKWKAWEGRRAMHKFLERQGVKIKATGNPNPFRFALDHRKIFVIDGKEAFTGGMNIGDKYRYEWHDVMIKITKVSVVEMFSKVFLSEYRRSHVPSKRLKEKYDYKLLVTNYKDKDVEKDLISHMKKSEDVIHIAVPYLTDIPFIRGLVEARKRGVKVKVIVPEACNHLLTRMQHWFTIKLLFLNGIEIYAYRDTLAHLKVFLFDDKHVSLGSANATYWSMKHNKELNFCTDDPNVINQVRKKVFEKDLKVSRRVESFWEHVG